MDLNKLSLGDRIVAGAGILLFLDLLILPWHHVSVPSVTVAGTKIGGGSINRTALESPNAFWGVLALLVVVVVVAAVLVSRLSTANLPELPIAWNQAIFYGTIAVAALLVIKLIAETDALGFGCWLALVLAAGLVYGGFLISKQSEPATA